MMKFNGYPIANLAARSSVLASMSLPARRVCVLLVVGAVGCRGAEAPIGQLPPAGSAAPMAPAVAAIDAAAADAGAADAGAAAVATAPCTDETSTVEGSSAPHDTLTLTRVAFADLPGWADDQLA